MMGQYEPRLMNGNMHAYLGEPSMLRGELTGDRVQVRSLRLLVSCVDAASKLVYIVMQIRLRHALSGYYVHVF